MTRVCKTSETIVQAPEPQKTSSFYLQDIQTFCIRSEKFSRKKMLKRSWLAGLVHQHWKVISSWTIRPGRLCWNSKVFRDTLPSKESKMTTYDLLDMHYGHEMVPQSMKHIMDVARGSRFWFKFIVDQTLSLSWCAAVIDQVNLSLKVVLPARVKKVQSEFAN